MHGVAVALPFLLFLLHAMHPLPTRAQDFSIRSFQSDIEVRGDASLRVTETIETVFHRPRHGLFRDIPFRYTDELGEKTVMPLRVVSVTDSAGKPLKYKEERTGGVLRIRIGDPDEYVEGTQVYAITYTVENAILFFPDHDELYWNATGNDWPTGIGSALATVSVANDGRPLTVRTRCFTGPRGSREEACRISLLPNGAKYLAGRKFLAGEGLTIVLGWNKGVVSPPSRWKQKLFLLNPAANWPFLAPPLTLLYMLVLWYRKGRDPSTGDPVVVAYAPPVEDGRPLHPAEAGALIDERLDPADITASIVDLAVKGHVTIEERKTPGFLFDKSEYFIRKEKAGGELLPFGRLLMEKLFPAEGTEVRVSDLKYKFYKHLDELKNAAFSGLERAGCFTANPLGVRSRYLYTGIAILIAGGFLGWLGDRFGGGASIRAVVAVALSGLVVILFAPLMPVKTLKGVKIRGRIKGFEEFLLRAEKDRLERMNDPNLFEKYLPYAIALGVADRWAKAFEEIFQEPPRWYVSGNTADTFRPSTFHHSLGSALTTMTAAMTASPRSGGSGFSGGGSSGGGGGGGGGGSW